MDDRDRTARADAYDVHEAARYLGLTVQQVRAYARSGLLEAERGARGELRLSFQDLVFLRLVKQLTASRIPPRRVRRALERLREALADGHPPSRVRLGAAGRELVAREGDVLWNPESGQCLLDFEAGSGSRVVALPAGSGDEVALRMDADDWYLLGCELEEDRPQEARRAYARALELDPKHADAHVNLGCLHHGARELAEAEAHYREALRARPDDDTAAFNLGVVLEDQGRAEEAREAYESALRANPACAEAHFNLARFYELRGRRAEAIRHLRAYRALARER